MRVFRELGAEEDIWDSDKQVAAAKEKAYMLLVGKAEG
jgi:hypothetical protein